MTKFRSLISAVFLLCLPSLFSTSYATGDCFSKTPETLNLEPGRTMSIYKFIPSGAAVGAYAGGFLGGVFSGITGTPVATAHAGVNATFVAIMIPGIGIFLAPSSFLLTYLSDMVAFIYSGAFAGGLVGGFWGGFSGAFLGAAFDNDWFAQLGVKVLPIENNQVRQLQASNYLSNNTELEGERTKGLTVGERALIEDARDTINQFIQSDESDESHTKFALIPLNTN